MTEQVLATTDSNARLQAHGIGAPRRALLPRLARRLLIPREEWRIAFRDRNLRRLVAIAAAVNLVAVTFMIYVQFRYALPGRSPQARGLIQAANLLSFVPFTVMVVMIWRYGVQAISIVAPATCGILTVAVCVAAYGSLLSSNSLLAYAANTHWLLLLYIVNPMCFRPLGARLLSGVATVLVIGMAVVWIVRQGGFDPTSLMHRSLMISAQVFISGLLMQETAFVVREKRAARVSATRQSLRDLRRQRVIERDLRAARENVMRLNRVSTVNAVASTIAHEVRQPLAAVTNLAGAARNWIRGDPPNLARAEASLESLSAEVQRASGVIEEIRALGTRGVSETAEVDVADLVRSTAGLAAHELSRRGVRLDVEIPPDAGAVHGRRTQLQQVLLNLLQNAIEAFDGQRAPHIRLVVDASAGDLLQISVIDNGPGITAEQMENIGRGLFTTKANGTGLGIVICRQILESHGGGLDLWGAPEGVTATLTLFRDGPGS